MASNAELSAAADQAIRSIKAGDADATIHAFATALGFDAGKARSLSAKEVRSIENRLNWTRDNIDRQLTRLGRIVLSMLADVEA